MKERLILIGVLTCLCVALSAAAAWATIISPPGEPGPPQPSSGPTGTAVTWTFATPFDGNQEPPYDGFLSGESGDILFCTQQIDVGDFVVPNFTLIGTTVVFNVPEQAPAGSCTVRAHGNTSGFEVTESFEVTASQVPYTGGTPKKTLPAWPLYLTGSLALAIGGAIVWRRTLAT